MTPTRQELEALVRAALEELSPRRLVREALLGSHQQKNWAHKHIRASLSDSENEESTYRNVIVLALGKAAAPMAQGALDALGDRIRKCVIAGPNWGTHPIPSPKSEAAGRALLAAATAARTGDQVIALVSGGGSALAVVPRQGLSITDLADAYRLLIASGRSIIDINTVRRQLSAIKGGLLAAAVVPANLCTLVLSDVPGNDLSAVASGPTIVPSPPIPNAYSIGQAVGLPQSMMAYLSDRETVKTAGQTTHQTTPRQEHRLDFPVVRLADNHLLVERVSAHALKHGVHALPVFGGLDGPIKNVVERVQTTFVDAAHQSLIVLGGESTVFVPPNAPPGGRLHHLAISLVEFVARFPRACALAISSDGVDGSCGAGAFIDSRTQDLFDRNAMVINDMIANRSAAPALRAIGRALPPAPSGHNLADLLLMWKP